MIFVKYYFLLTKEAQRVWECVSEMCECLWLCASIFLCVSLCMCTCSCVMVCEHVHMSAWLYVYDL